MAINAATGRSCKFSCRCMVVAPSVLQNQLYEQDQSPRWAAGPLQMDVHWLHTAVRRQQRRHSTAHGLAAMQPGPFAFWGRH